MNLKEDIIFILESNEKSYEKILNKLNEYDVEGLDNLINLISCMYKNEYFIDFYNGIEKIIDSNEYKYTKNPIHNSKNDFINMADNKLKSPKFISGKYLITLTTIEAVLSVVEFNFYFYSNANIKSINNVSNLIFNGNIISHLTFHVDDFKNDLPLPIYSEEYFQHLGNIKFDGKKSKQLHKDILWNYLSIIIIENNITYRFNNTICTCAKYLMACNALKHGRDSVSCEDVVVGYTLALKLLTEDIREYVIKYYNEDKDLKISDFIVDENSGDVQDEGLGFKGVVSIIFAILAFLEVILVTTAIISPLGLEFANNPIIRIPTLIVSFFVARKFYNYLTEGNDKDLFEKGKSKAMVLFIIIFIITSVIGFI